MKIFQNVTDFILVSLDIKNYKNLHFTLDYLVVYWYLNIFNPRRNISSWKSQRQKILNAVRDVRHRPPCLVKLSRKSHWKVTSSDRWALRLWHRIRKINIHQPENQFQPLKKPLGKVLLKTKKTLSCFHKVVVTRVEVWKNQKTRSFTMTYRNKDRRFLLILWNKHWKISTLLCTVDRVQLLRTPAVLSRGPFINKTSGWQLIF